MMMAMAPYATGDSSVSIISLETPMFDMMEATKPAEPPTRGVLNILSQAWDFTQEGIM